MPADERTSAEFRCNGLRKLNRIAQAMPRRRVFGSGAVAPCRRFFADVFLMVLQFLHDPFDVAARQAPVGQFLAQVVK